MAAITETEVAAEVTETTRRRRRTWRERLPRRDIWIGVAGVGVFLGLWELAVIRRWVNPTFVASVGQTARELGHLLTTRMFWGDMAVSGKELGIGMGISIVAGLAIGVAYGWSRTVAAALTPFVNGLNAMPQIAIIPILILFFGIGIWSKVAIVVLITITTFIMNTATGIATIDRDLQRMSRSFGAKTPQLLWTVGIPHAVPYILTSLRLGMGRGLIGIVAGELFASRAGVGHLLVIAADNFDTGVLYASLVVFTVTGILLNVSIGRLEKHLGAWRG